MRTWHRVAAATVQLAAWAALACAPSCSSDPCSEPVSAYAASSYPSCPSTWSAVQTPATWNGSCLAVKTYRCGALDLARRQGVDAGTSCYYDHSTGALVRVEDWGSSGTPTTTCIAGSGDSPSCDLSQPTSLQCG